MTKTAPTPRIRMFAGPNGSGKSTLIRALSHELLGVCVNADDIERSIAQEGRINFEQFELGVNETEARSFFASSSRLTEEKSLYSRQEILDAVSVRDNSLSISPIKVNSYIAATVADLICQQLTLRRKSFSFDDAQDDGCSRLVQAVCPRPHLNLP